MKLKIYLEKGETQQSAEEILLKAISSKYDVSKIPHPDPVVEEISLKMQHEYNKQLVASFGEVLEVIKMRNEFGKSEEFEKGRKPYPIGTVRGNYKKVAEGKWVLVKEQKQNIKEEKTEPTDEIEQSAQKNQIHDPIAYAEEIESREEKKPSTEKILNDLKKQIESGVVTVYHGTTKSAAEKITKEGFKGLNVDEIIDEAYKLNNISKKEIPKEIREYIESDAQSRKEMRAEEGKMSFTLSPKVAQRFAGQGGEILQELDKRIRNYLQAKQEGKADTPEQYEEYDGYTPYRKIGEPEVLESKVKIDENQKKYLLDHVDNYLKQDNKDGFFEHYVDIRVSPKNVSDIKKHEGLEKSNLEKGRKPMPVGTISGDYKKVAEGKWEKITDKKQDVKEKTEPEKIKLTRSSLSKVVKWSTSKYNEYKKEEVIEKMYDILKNKKDEKRIFITGTYTEATGGVGWDYLVDGKAGTVSEGYGSRIDIFEAKKTYKFDVSEAKEFQPSKSAIRKEEERKKRVEERQKQAEEAKKEHEEKKKKEAEVKKDPQVIEKIKKLVEFEKKMKSEPFIDPRWFGVISDLKNDLWRAGILDIEAFKKEIE